MSFKSCPKCGENKPVSEFYPAPKSRNKDKLQSWCKSCARISSNAFVKNRAKEIRNFLNEYKMKCGCVDCGYNESPHALDFDHLRDKKFGLSYSMTRPMQAILEEISKCEVVCANCHRIRTHERIRENVVPNSAE